MSIFQPTDMDITCAQRIWAEYQRHHDLSALLGQTAGIDPVSGKVWLGDSILDISQQLEAQGVNSQLYFVRVGQDHYYRKGGRRG